MKTIIGLLISALFFNSETPVPSGSNTLTVYIIRHGEKPKKGDNLSCAGLNRALALPPVLTKLVGKPDYTYVPTMDTGTHTKSVRMFQTVTPFAVQQGLAINSQFPESDTTAAATDVLTRRGVVLMVWEHTNIPGLARQLGVPDTYDLTWKGTDFDRIWIITFKAAANNGLQFSSFVKGREGINPSDTCK